jgi:phytoene dehydrogenase-like protein
MKRVIIVGSGINGLVTANYLVKAGYNVSIIEKKEFTGGACIKDSLTIEGKNIDFSYGATVLGMMPEFIFNETGLVNEVEGFYPKTPKLVYFKDEEDSTKIFQDSIELEKELKNKWGETGRIDDFRNDENKVIKFIQKLYKEAITPTVEIAYKELGAKIADLWVFGTAKNLLDHYFTSEKSKLYMGMTVIESGPASIYDPGTAFTIPLMDSGSVFDGYWGFVKTGIWKITETLSDINLDLGVKINLNSSITEVDTKSKIISYIKDDKDIKLNYDFLIFATDPITPSKLIKGFKQDIELDEIGTSGKVTAFFRNPVKWKDSNEYSDSFRFIFSNNNLNHLEEASQNALKNSGDYFAGFIQIYPDGSAQRTMNNKENYDKLILFSKNLSYDKKADDLDKVKNEIIKTVLPYIENADDLVYSKFLTPKDLNETFFFPKGNIDHITLTGKQNFNKRTFSKNPNNFYSYYDLKDVYYCGAGSFPCGSVAGTAGYMCSKQLIRNDH